MILYICSDESDYLQDLTYAGLCDVLGKDNVWDYPFHWQYHSEKKFFWNRKEEYPRNLGYVPTDKLCTVSSLSELTQSLRKNHFDLVVLASAKPDALHVFESLFDDFKCPWIFIDGGDWQGIGGDFKRLGGETSFKLFEELSNEKRPGIIFKRELPLNVNYDFVFPLQFSVHASRAPVLDPQTPKKYQVLFWAVESSPVRKQAFKLLEGRYDCESNGSVQGQKFRKYRFRGVNYFKALSESRINLSFRGEGFDTLRYWETPASGSLLISEQPTIQIPNNFAYSRQAVFCKPDLSNLLSLIDYYLGHENERIDIAREGQKHLLQHHTHIKRAEYLLDIVESRLKLRLR